MKGVYRISSSVALVFFLGLSGLQGCKDKEEVVAEAVIRPVRVVRIADAGAVRMQSLPGVARSSQEMQLSFRVSGTISTLKVKRGDRVKKKQLVAELDKKDVQLEIQRARASVARAKAEHRSAQADYERTRLLYADGSASRSELDAARALEESKRAMHSAELKGLELTQSKLADHRLLVPLDGGIADVPVEVNENVQAGQPIALLNSGSLAEVEVGVPERLIQLCEQGAPAEITFDSLPDELFAGVISEVGVAADSSSTAFPVRVRLNKEDMRIRSGMAAVVRLKFQDKSSTPRVYVAPEAVKEASTSKERFVFLAIPTEPGFAEVKKQVVTIGEPSTMGLAVGSGLKGGELVVVAGLSLLQDGMKVRLLKKDQPKYALARIEAMDAPDALEPINEDPSIKPDSLEQVTPAQGKAKAGGSKP